LLVCSSFVSKMEMCVSVLITQIEDGDKAFVYVSDIKRPHDVSRNGSLGFASSASLRHILLDYIPQITMV